jgi:hypothetical protein
MMDTLEQRLTEIRTSIQTEKKPMMEAMMVIDQKYAPMLKLADDEIKSLQSTRSRLTAEIRKAEAEQKALAPLSEHQITLDVLSHWTMKELGLTAQDVV